ncbi:DgyrCDS11080 [Dimorphilus gyrociliatus]|uniref:DgyrCDS11080 n=1 Tax=Dimorphilus gyrociliatus TaxID=2664684 RepID=A0A7I8W794_9ANNE|nr:DgyrCDS11080 [Dimorphilus gyrociliatus]
MENINEDILKLKGEAPHLEIKNDLIRNMTSDNLYHLALSTRTHNFKEMFQDIKFVCVGGSSKRMEKFAQFIASELGIKTPCINLASETDRYALFKAGPVLIASHGIGTPSISIVMHEILKLLYHARCQDKVTFFRLGTCGGLGLKPGTVVISDTAVDGLFREKYEARLDGAFCGYTQDQKMAFLIEAYKKGVRNIEMESLCFLAMCHQANVKGAVICVTLLDRLKSDQISETKTTLKEWEERPAKIALRYIKSELSKN